MRLGLLSHTVSRASGGLFNSVRHLALELKSGRGVDVAVLTAEDKYIGQDLAAWGGIDVQTHELAGPTGFGYMKGLLHSAMSGGFDVLHCQHIWMYPSVVELAWGSRLKRPYVISPRGMLDSWALRNSPAKKALASLLFERAHIARAACMHALCEPEARAIRAYGYKGPICLIPNGTDLPKLGLPGELNGAMGDIPDGAKVLLFLGRIDRKKGLDLLLRAWAASRARGAYDDWRLVIVGWGDEAFRAELEGMRQELRITSSTHIGGSVYGQQKDACYRAASAFILPSLSEGVPMSVLEGMSYALPGIVTPQCNLPQVVASGAGIETETTVDSIARALGILLEMHDDERAAMGARGRELAEREFAWARIAAHMHEVYSWVTGASSTRPPHVSVI
jgi:glycosyltransferase involved in cell wall biosynthesis